MKVTTSILTALDDWWDGPGEYQNVTNAWLDGVAATGRTQHVKIGFFCYEDHA